MFFTIKREELQIMNKIFFTILTLFLYINSYSEAIFSGNISTVNPRSGINALRNPALMSRQNEDDFSFIYVYSYLMNSDVNSDAKVLGLKVNSDVTMDEAFNGAAYISNVWVSGRNAYGIGVSKTGDGQVKISSSDYQVDVNRSVEDKTYVGSTLFLSYSYRINSKQSIGLQIETNASNEYTDKDKKTDNKELEITTNKFSWGGTLGYYIHENQFSFGAMLKPGLYGIENNKYDLNDKTLMTETHKNISNYYVHNESLSGILGFGYRPNYKLMLAIEAGSLLPYTKEEKSCDDSLVEANTKTKLKYAGLIRAGIDYAYNAALSIDFGAGYTRYKAESEDNYFKTSSFIYSIGQVTAGLDIKPSKDYHLLFGLSYSKFFQKINLDQSPSLSLKLDVVQDNLDIIAGVSCYY